MPAEVAAFKLADIEIHGVFGDIKALGDLINRILNIEDPFLIQAQYNLAVFALLDTLRSALTSSMENSSVCATRSSTDEAKFTDEAISCVSGE